jgi:hypothetical protein
MPAPMNRPMVVAIGIPMMLPNKPAIEEPTPSPVIRETIRPIKPPIMEVMREQSIAKIRGFRKSPSLRMLLKKFTGLMMTSRTVWMKLGTRSL